MKTIGKIIKHSSFALAALMILLSVAAAVWGYEVIDPDDYRLVIQEVRVASHDDITFDVYNQGLNDFNYLDLYSYDMEYDSTKTTTKFSHSLGQPLAVLGILERHAAQTFTLPFDNSKATGKQLKCGKSIKLELFDNKGKAMAKWAGIPKCLIEAPKPDGLLKLSESKTEYNDDATRITWELLEFDRVLSRVQLRKTQGLLEPKTAWYSNSDCPDVEGGNCMTRLSITFGQENVWVTLYDQRKSTSVTISLPLWDPAEETFEIIEDAPEDMVADTYDISDLEVTEADSNVQVRDCLEGCPAENSCFSSGTQTMLHDIDVYCEGQTWLVQKKDGSACDKDYECVSGSCRGTCSGTGDAKQSWITRLLQWIDNLI